MGKCSSKDYRPKLDVLLILLVVLNAFRVCTSNDAICTNGGECQLVDYTVVPPLCHSMQQFYNNTLFPTSIHDTQGVASTEISSFASITDLFSDCSEVATNFLCAFYIPPCFNVNSDCMAVLSPCRRLCQEVSDCLLHEYGVTEEEITALLPPYLNCSNFDNSGQCWGPPTFYSASVVTSTSTISDSSVAATSMTSTGNSFPSEYSLSLASPAVSDQLPYISETSLETPYPSIITPSPTIQPSLHSSSYDVQSSIYNPSTESSRVDLLSLSFGQKHSDLFNTGSFRSSTTSSSLQPVQTLTTEQYTHTIETASKMDLQPSQTLPVVQETPSRGFLKSNTMLSVVLCAGWAAVAFISCWM